MRHCGGRCHRPYCGKARDGANKSALVSAMQERFCLKQFISLLPFVVARVPVALAVGIRDSILAPGVTAICTAESVVADWLGLPGRSLLPVG